MQTWTDGFDKAKLTGWKQLDTVWPDWMPYYPEPPVNHADWKLKGGVLEVTSKANAWSYQLRGQPTDTDYTLAFDMMVPTMTPDRVESFAHRFISRVTGEFEPCWETAAVVRYTDQDHFYRVQFGTIAGGNETGVGGGLALWSPQGGFLQVVPHGGKNFVWRKVKVVCAGDVIEVWLDGKLKIHYRDTVAPNLKGRCGIGAAGTQFYRYDNVALKRNRGVLPAEKAVRPGVGKKVFGLRYFMRQQYLFCNNEPIARIDPASSIIQAVCLRPGYRPMLAFGLHWDQYTGPADNFVNIKEEWVVEKRNGPEFAVRYAFRNPKGNLKVNGRLTVSYDSKRNTYLWDVDTTVKVAEGSTWKNVTHGLSFADPVIHYFVPHSVDVPKPMPFLYDWIVFHGPEGKLFRHPVLHSHVPPAKKDMPLKLDGGQAVMMYDELANPALEFDFSPKTDLRGAFWLCPWAYDVHFQIDPYEKGENIPGGTKHRAKFRYLSVHGPKAKAMFDGSKVHPYWNSLPPRMEYRSGVNTFDKLTPMNVPHRGYPWVGGTWDGKVGHAAPGSLRLNVTKKPARPKQILAHVGGSSFMGRFDARHYTVTGWVKTQGVKGKGARLFVKNGQIVLYSEAVKGDSDWTKFEIQTEILYGITGGAAVGVELDGTGTVWLDDLQVDPGGR